MNTQHIGDLVLSQQQIQQGVEKVAKTLNEKYQGEEVVVITIVPGGILFTADLIRQLTFDNNMDYISCPHTPGDSQNNSSIIFHQNIDIKGKHVILIDDAIESGGTMKRLAAFIADYFAIKSLSIATLFVKPNRVDIPFTQHFAYEMDNDDLLVGYGLPWQNRLRNVPYISKLIK
ncbi:MAG: phosphoribosyltransferase family protein [Psychromonas sp.]